MVYEKSYSDSIRNISVETDFSCIEGKAKKVFYPKTLADIQRIMKLTDRLTIRGGGSGMVGGAVPQNSSVLDMNKMNAITEMDINKKTITVNRYGVITEIN